MLLKATAQRTPAVYEDTYINMYEDTYIGMSAASKACQQLAKHVSSE
jgi:hypothetical protein